MDRNLVISASVAAALHAGLLFGIPGSPAKPVAATVTCALPLRPPFEVDLAPPPDSAETSTAIGSPDRAPRSPEPIVDPSTAVFVIKTPDTPPTSINVPVSTIPLGPPGDITGKIDGVGTKPGTGFTLADLDGTPRTRVQTSPIYPYEAKQNGMTGEVVVEFTVDEGGGVLDPHVAKSSSHVFNDAAVRAVARWKFEPGKRGGRPVRFRMAVPIVFNLNNDL